MNISILGHGKETGIFSVWHAKVLQDQSLFQSGHSQGCFRLSLPSRATTDSWLLCPTDLSWVLLPGQPARPPGSGKDGCADQDNLSTAPCRGFGCAESVLFHVQYIRLSKSGHCAFLTKNTDEEETYPGART